WRGGGGVAAFAVPGGGLLAGPPIPRRLLRRWVRPPRVAPAMALALACACLAVQPAASQDASFLTFKQQQRPKPPKAPSLAHPPADAQILVKANEAHYDYTNHRLAAVANAPSNYNAAPSQPHRAASD